MERLVRSDDDGPKIDHPHTTHLAPGGGSEAGARQVKLTEAAKLSDAHRSELVTAGPGSAKARSEAGSAVSRDAMVAEARLKGYEGDACVECGSLTMVRNGSCLKCESCGSTSGCS